MTPPKNNIAEHAKILLLFIIFKREKKLKYVLNTTQVIISNNEINHRETEHKKKINTLGL